MEASEPPREDHRRSEGPHRAVYVSCLQAIALIHDGDSRLSYRQSLLIFREYHSRSRCSGLRYFQFRASYGESKASWALSRELSSGRSEKRVSPCKPQCNVAPRQSQCTLQSSRRDLFRHPESHRACARRTSRSGPPPDLSERLRLVGMRGYETGLRL